MSVAPYPVARTILSNAKTVKPISNRDAFDLVNRDASDDLPAPDVMAAEHADDLEAALEQFTAFATKLKSRR